jgi:hypothetical protein
MTITLSNKMLIVSALAIACIAPAFANAETRDDEASTVRINKEKRGMKTASTSVDRSCMATAVATREASIKTAWTTFSGSITTALDKRATALVAAWNTDGDSSKNARKEAWDDWKEASKSAHTKLRSDRKSAWETFKKTAKDSCKVKTPKEEALGKEAKDSISI